MPDNKDFDFDLLKQAWQKQMISNEYGQSEIEAMLNRSSRNYVRYILWISLTEFVIFGFLNFLAFSSPSFHTDFTAILTKLKIKNQHEVEHSLEKIYYFTKILSLFITGVFVLIFYLNYKKINVEANLKSFIKHIIRFKKTVNLFIVSNVFLLVLFVGIFVGFIFVTVKDQGLQIENNIFWLMISAVVVSLLICTLLIFVYYKLAYGILLGRLSSNLNHLEKIDSGKA